jgi:hypothetical protein
VVKLTRTARLPWGLKLYRGLRGMKMPERFCEADERGFLGYTEWGFLSTTSNKPTAIEVFCGREIVSHFYFVKSQRNGQ